MGENGAGKSTLFDLLVHFYEYRGKINIGGMDINQVKIDQLRNKLCYIQQNSLFFNMSIYAGQ